LNDNQLSGSIPKELDNLNNLFTLTLQNNQLSGCYDDALINLCGQLDIYFSNNYNISDGNDFDATWEDFCLDGAGGCGDSAPDPVWPGDFNYDGIVRADDLLYLGVADGFSGATRPNATFDWSSQPCQDWSYSVGGINGKHQDGDGDGLVTVDDVDALQQNYGNTHNYTPMVYFTEVVQYRLELISSIPNGSIITNTYELYADSPSGVPISTHGLACSINFDLLVNSVSVDVSNSSLMPNEYIDIYLAEQNRLDLALTRTDNNNQTLDGPVANIIIDAEDLQIVNPFGILISNGSMMSANGHLTAINDATFQGSFTGGPTVTDNLAVNVFTVHESCNRLGSATAQVTGGTAPYTYAWSTGTATNEISYLPSGTYTVTVSDAAGLSTTVPFQINGQPPIYDANGNLLCGSICPDYLTPSGVVPNGLYNANITLDSDAVVPTGDDVQFKAGQTIKLDKGFTVQPGASFSGEIEDCN